VILAIAIILAVVLFPTPWNIVVVVVGIVLEFGEITWGLRLARRMRAQTGAEALVGQEAQVVEPCRPGGKVRVHGELWQARCEEGADAGDTVRVTAVRGLTLDVVPSG
jgi:membrane-bound serine protease (ClpP class)